MLIDARKHPWYLELTLAEMEAVIAAVPALVEVAKAVDRAEGVEEGYPLPLSQAIWALDAAAPDWREWSA